MPRHTSSDQAAARDSPCGIPFHVNSAGPAVAPVTSRNRMAACGFAAPSVPMNKGSTCESLGADEHSTTTVTVPRSSKTSPGNQHRSSGRRAPHLMGRLLAVAHRPTGGDAARSPAPLYRERGHPHWDDRSPPHLTLESHLEVQPGAHRADEIRNVVGGYAEFCNQDDEEHGWPSSDSRRWRPTRQAPMARVRCQLLAAVRGWPPTEAGCAAPGSPGTLARG